MIVNYDINTDKLRANCFRQSKVPGEFMFQIRVPGAIIDAKWLSLVQEIAQTYGNGTCHLGPRQTVNIPGILYQNIEAVNRMIAPYIEAIECDACGIDMQVGDKGYPTLAARNIMGCIGSDHCPKANVQVSNLARKLEKVIFPSNYHIKICIAACPNDCIKAHMTDFGIMAVTLPQYRADRCISCGACVRDCDARSTGALSFDGATRQIIRNERICIGCGECVESCPTRAFIRSPQVYYCLLVGGRTSRTSPRVGKVFLNYITEDVLCAVLGNWHEFSANTLDYKPLYVHGGHLIDRAGYQKFKTMMLQGVQLNPEARVATRINWNEQEYRANINVK